MTRRRPRPDPPTTAKNTEPPMQNHAMNAELIERISQLDDPDIPLNVRRSMAAHLRNEIGNDPALSAYLDLYEKGLKKARSQPPVHPWPMTEDGSPVDVIGEPDVSLEPGEVLLSDWWGDITPRFRSLVQEGHLTPLQGLALQACFVNEGMGKLGNPTFLYSNLTKPYNVPQAYEFFSYLLKSRGLKRRTPKEFKKLARQALAKLEQLRED